MKKLNLIDKIIYIVNVFIGLALLFSYLLPLVSPKTIPLFAILSLFVPFLIIINILFSIYWIVKLKKQFLLSLIILIIGWGFNSSLFKISGKNDAINKQLSIMSYNVRMFNHWKWIDNDSIVSNIFRFIKSKNPDIVVFQEYYTQEKNQLNYPFKFIKTKNNKRKIGLAIFSKYQIINEGSLDLINTNNNIIYADIVKGKDTIRVYNLHLQSLQLNTKKENFGEENSTKLISRLKENFTKQASQTAIFTNHEKLWKGKKIVTGDFNNTSYSWVYNEIVKEKKDAFIEAGSGFGKTFDYWFPLRIDFILTDSAATINSFNTFPEEKNSDHYPITATLHWN
ncbi:MAG: endonuclease/exonuclease/phosphatase family protein [Flavobacteriaceae bacterium]|nr:endonuclease/exonuclease/phosphatase family protein [Flavobacteriaceae bacterium]